MNIAYMNTTSTWRESKKSCQARIQYKCLYREHKHA